LNGFPVEKLNTMKRLLIPLMAVCVANAGVAPVQAYGELKAATSDFAIIIDGKTKNIELWVTFNREVAESLIKSGRLPSLMGVYASGGPFSGGGEPSGRIIGRGKCNLPPNSSISAFRDTSLNFVTSIIFKFESSIKRNSKLVTKTDELRKDGSYVAVIERTTVGYHH
jgi:hypothetical protein